MSCTPSEPEERHVWVLGHGGHGPPAPGVVVSWQHAPVRNATSAAWVALVVVAPFDAALFVTWVGAERLVGVRDPAPVDERR